MLFSKRMEHYFKLIETGDFTQAAEHLNITTSALRHSVFTFERYCGEKLILKKGKKIHPTYAGSLIYDKLYPLYGKSKEIINNLPLNINNYERIVKVMLGGFYYPEIPQLFIELSEKTNNQYLISDSARSCYDELKDNSCDMAICSYFNGDMPETDGLNKTHLSNESIGLLVQKELISRHSDIKSLLSEIPLLFCGSFFSQPSFYNLKTKLNNEGFFCKFSGLPHFMDILGAVENGTRITLIPESARNNIVFNEESTIFLKKPFPFDLEINRSVYLKENRFNEMQSIVDFLSRRL
jgi:DNA-binding transcriptional LysR family regulator